MSIENSTRRTIYEQANGQCEICKENLNWKQKDNKLRTMSIDHKLPVSKGGNDNRNNLRCLCPSCNHRKGNLIGEELKQHFKNKISGLNIDFVRLKDDINCGFSSLNDVYDIEDVLESKIDELKKQFREFYRNNK
jgi:5-methylcytosine-specific restriction endonuclease McrA